MLHAVVISFGGKESTRQSGEVPVHVLLIGGKSRDPHLSGEVRQGGFEVANCYFEGTELAYAALTDRDRTSFRDYGFEVGSEGEGVISPDGRDIFSAN